MGKYKILNRLFGWDYVYWKNLVDQGVARVIVLPSGELAYWRYKNSEILDVIKSPDQVIWLTCTPDKYGF